MKEERIAAIRAKFEAVKPALRERGRRLWAGAEANSLGRGGVAWVAAATGMAVSTVRKGRDEVRAGGPDLVGRERRAGGGRPRREKQDPGLMPHLERLVSPTTRGDPESPLRWTCKSVRVLSRELTKAKHPVGPSKVGELLRAAGYSLQANAKTKEGCKHPERDAQFAFINAQAENFLARGQPVISVDAKKKEAIAEHANPGREWQPKGKRVQVMAHDFFDRGESKATPYGVYDVLQNEGFVNVGTNHNTPTFAVRSIEKWWDQMGHKRYPAAKELFITADAGGSNGLKSHVWKAELQRVADRTGLQIHVSHFPPGTSKWNKIEHRLFSFITLNWRGRPLISYETVVSLIAATTTSKGLRVKAELDTEKYPLGRSVTKEAFALLNLQRAPFCGQWNYSFRPRTPQELTRTQALPPPRTKVSQAERKAMWLKLIREQQASGLSNRRFCLERGIKFGSFIVARRRIVGRIHARGYAGK